jgi:hypothetical protein
MTGAIQAYGVVVNCRITAKHADYRESKTATTQQGTIGDNALGSARIRIPKAAKPSERPASRD